MYWSVPASTRAFQVPPPPVMLRSVLFVKSSYPPPTSTPVPTRPTHVCVVSGPAPAALTPRFAGAGSGCTGTSSWTTAPVMAAAFAVIALAGGMMLRTGAARGDVWIGGLTLMSTLAGAVTSAPLGVVAVAAGPVSTVLGTADGAD